MSGLPEALLLWYNEFDGKAECVKDLKNAWTLLADPLKRIISQKARAVNVCFNTPRDAYFELRSFLCSIEDQRAFAEILSATDAADGDRREIAKFLLVLMNEYRVTLPELIEGHSAARFAQARLDDVISTAFTKLDLSTSDPRSWWSIVNDAFSDNDENEPPPSSCINERRKNEDYFCAPAGMAAVGFSTPKPPNRRRDIQATPRTAVASVSINSPLTEVIHSPKIREIRRERELKELQAHVRELEEKYYNANQEAKDMELKNNELTKENAAYRKSAYDYKTGQNESQKEKEALEVRLDALQRLFDNTKRSHDEFRDQVRNYRTQLEKKDQDISTLRENLTESASKVTQLNKKIRDAQDEAMECMKSRDEFQRALDGLQQKILSMQTANDEITSEMADKNEYFRKKMEEFNVEKTQLMNDDMMAKAELNRTILELTERNEKLVFEQNKVEEELRANNAKHDEALRNMEAEMVVGEAKWRERIDDLTKRQELESAKLVRDKEKAIADMKRFKELLDEKERELQKEGTIIAEHLTTILSTDEQLAALRDELRTTKTKLNDAEEEYSTLSDAMEILKQEHSQFAEIHATCIAEEQYKELRNSNALLEHQCNDLKIDLQEYNAKVSKLSDDLTIKDDQLSSALLENDTVLRLGKEHEKNAIAAQRLYNEECDKSKKLDEEHNGLLKDFTALRNKVQQLENQKQQDNTLHASEIERMQTRMNMLDQEKDFFTKQFHEASEQATKLHKQVMELTARQYEMGKALMQKEAENAHMQITHESEISEFSSRVSKMDELWVQVQEASKINETVCSENEELKKKLELAHHRNAQLEADHRRPHDISMISRRSRYVQLAQDLENTIPNIDEDSEMTSTMEHKALDSNDWVDDVAHDEASSSTSSVMVQDNLTRRSNNNNNSGRVPPSIRFEV